MAVATVQRRGRAARAQIVERLQVGGGQILHVDIVSDAGAVGRGVVGAIDGDMIEEVAGQAAAPTVATG